MSYTQLDIGALPTPTSADCFLTAGWMGRLGRSFFNVIQNSFGDSLFLAVQGCNASWTPLAAPLGSHFASIMRQSADGSKIYVAPDLPGCTLYYSHDSGATWTTKTVGDTGHPYQNQLCASADGSVVNVTSSSVLHSGNFALYVSTDSGATFTEKAVPAGSAVIINIDCDSTGAKIVITGKDGGGTSRVWVSTDSGTSWTAAGYTITGGGYFYGVRCSADFSTIVAFGTGVSGNPVDVIVFSNLGASWIVHANLMTPFSIVVSGDGTKIFVFGRNSSGVGGSVLEVSIDSGVTFNPNTGFLSSLTAGGVAGTVDMMAATSDFSKVVFSGQSGYCVYTDDLGVTWNSYDLYIAVNGAVSLSSDGSTILISEAFGDGRIWKGPGTTASSLWSYQTYDSSGASIVNGTRYAGSLADGWHSWAVSMQMSTQTAQIMVDRTLGHVIDEVWSSSNPVGYFLDEPWQIGPMQGTIDNVGVDMGDFFFDAMTSFFDLTNTTNVNKLFGVSNYRITWGEDGSLVTGSQPVVYLVGYHLDYPTNLGNAGPFTVSGDPLVDASTLPPN